LHIKKEKSHARKKKVYVFMVMGMHS
jgi:hypothetical protein